MRSSRQGPIDLRCLLRSRSAVSVILNDANFSILRGRELACCVVLYLFSLVKLFDFRFEDVRVPQSLP